MNQGKDTAALSEWKLHWPLLLSATIGISFGGIPIITLGLFMEPLQAEFGWSRTLISMGTIVFAAISALLAPVAGALVDRFGARALVIPGLILCGITFSAFSLQNGMVSLWIGSWLVYSLVAILIRSVVWNPSVSTAFVANRGVAIAVLLTGMSIASAGSPLVANGLIENFGWRGAYIGIGLGWTGVALALVIPFFRIREAPGDENDTQTVRSAPRTVPGGLTFKEAVRDSVLLRIAGAALLLGSLGSALGVHMVPIYTWLGVERGQAAGIALLYGAAGALSKLVVGSIADRVTSQFLPPVAFGIGGVGYVALLMSNGSLPIILIGTVVIGTGSGAMIHMIMYLTTQYGGLRNFGKIYGSVSALFGVAGGLGPVAAGMIYDTTQSYELFLLGALPLFAVAAALVFRLGAYPQFEPVPAR